MATFKNEFSWSKTRDEIFKTCPRQYWFAYYGFWNGWLKDAPERTRQIYVLKNLKNRQTWAGEKIHQLHSQKHQQYSERNQSPPCGRDYLHHP